MTSKNSIPNKKESGSPSISMWSLMRDDLRHRTWMILLSILGSFIASPVAYLFYNSGLRHSVYLTDETEWYQQLSELIIQYLGSTHLVLQLIIIYAGVLIVAIYGFRHLFSREMTDLYHCMPITRTKLFFAHYINGFLIWFVPFLAGHLSVYIMALFYVGKPEYQSAISAIIFKETGLFILCFLILYHACLVPIMISGNMKNTILSILIYGLGVSLGFLAIISYMSAYFDTFYFTDAMAVSPVMVGLSPLAAPVYLCLWFIEFQTESGLLNGSTAMENTWSALWIAVLIMMVVNLMLAVILHKKRPSELAERGVDNKWFRIPLRFTVSILCGLLLSFFFAVMTGIRTALVWSLFGAVFGCAFVFCVMNILYHASFKAMLAHKLQLVCSLLVTCAIMLIFRYDVFGYDSYLPGKENIKGLSIYCTDFKGPGYKLVRGEDGGYYTAPTHIEIPEELTFTDRDAIYRFLELMADLPNSQAQNHRLNDTKYYYELSVRVDTTTGSYYRLYHFYATDEITAAMEPFTNNRAFVEHYDPLGCGLLDAPVQINVDFPRNSTVQITDTQTIQELYKAYTLDFTEHYSLSNKLADFQLIILTFMYPRDTYDSSYCYVYLNIPSWYTHTIDVLKEAYPAFTWSQDELDFTSLEVDIHSDLAGDRLSELEAYLGIGTGAAHVATDSEKPSHRIWYGYLSDPDKLESLRPYLYPDNRKTYCSEDYIYIGRINTLNSSSTSRTYNCYIKRGEVPPWLVEDLYLKNE